MPKKRQNLVDTPEVEDKVLQVTREAGVPVSTDFVAHNVGMAWHQIRALLFRLVAEQKLSALKTTKGWVFYPTEYIPPLIEGGMRQRGCARGGA